MKFTANINSPILRHVAIECPGSGKAEIGSKSVYMKGRMDLSTAVPIWDDRIRTRAGPAPSGAGPRSPCPLS